MEEENKTETIEKNHTITEEVDGKDPEFDGDEENYEDQSTENENIEEKEKNEL